MTISLIIALGVVAYLAISVVAARMIAKVDGSHPEAWTRDDTGEVLFLGFFWPFGIPIALVCGFLWATEGFINPAAKAAKKQKSAAFTLRANAGELHRSALLVEDTPAFDALETMAADLRRQADALDGKNTT